MFVDCVWTVELGTLWSEVVCCVGRGDCVYGEVVCCLCVCLCKHVCELLYVCTYVGEVP